MQTDNKQLSIQTEPDITSMINEIEIFYKRKLSYDEMPKVSTSKDASDYLRRYWGRRSMDHVEQFMTLYMNRANKIMGWTRISLGGTSGTVVDPKVIFQVALKANANSLILAHNHPSGNVKPSDADIRLTKKLKDAGVFLDLPVLDHIILTSEKYYSFADEGKL